MDRALAGEYEPQLVAWVDALAGANGSAALSSDIIQLAKHAYHAPARELLPPIDRYARLAVDGEERLAGYVEASHGCVHKCRHCPVPVVYDGRIRIVGADTVLDDIGRLVDAGARHITFGDPDFLNGWRHSRKVVRAMHARFPDLTFDCTTKVEHILEHAHVWPEFADAGCLFVISAFESLNDRILERLDKGHVAAEAEQAVTLLRRHGIETRPSWLPFTPWTSFADVLDILDFVARHDLVGNVDPVQYAVRLLIPPGSHLLNRDAMKPHLGSLDQSAFSYHWSHPDPRMDELHKTVSGLAERESQAGVEPCETFYSLWQLAASLQGGAPPDHRAFPRDQERAPRLTEPWFC